MKSAWKSKTIWGLVLAALPTLARVFGVELTESESAAALEAMMTLSGVALAAYGRAVASGPLVSRDFKAGGGAMLVAAILLGVPVATQPGCASLDPAQRAALTNRLISGASTLALSIAAHELTRKNPGIAPYLQGLAHTLTFAADGGVVDAAAVRHLLEGYIATEIEDPFYRSALSAAVVEVLADYEMAYGLAGAPPDDPRLRAVLRKMSLALELAMQPDGVTGATRSAFAIAW